MNEFPNPGEDAEDDVAPEPTEYHGEDVDDDVQDPDVKEATDE